MSRLKELEKNMFGSASSSPDPNKLYSILLDTRASNASENMYDISEKILSNEKDNAKFALEQLWELKKNLTDESENSTVDILITFYQDKLNVVRNKEEYIKKISKDSRELLEEKRNHDSEVANVKQEMSECSSEINRLTTKMNQLKVKEQELLLIGGQLEKELQLNTNEVVNGLYEIILIGQDNNESGFSLDKELPSDEYIKIESEKDIGTDVLDPFEIKDSTEYVASEINVEIKEEFIFPKSVVKTTKGTVIGEYYYESSLNKDRRCYIFNSRFFCNSLERSVKLLKNSFDKDIYAETLQMVQDGFRRVPDSKNIFFEVSTNEILNKKSLMEILKNLSEKNYDEVLKASQRLKAKIFNLGSNYVLMLKEQMARYNI